MTVKDYNFCVDKFSDNIYRFIYKNIHDEEKAKDVVQDSYEKLWINRNSVNFDKVKSYLFTTAYHTMIDMIRREKRFSDNFENASKTLSHNEKYSDLQEILHAAVEKLPCDQKAVLMLRDYEGYSYKEISDITKLTEAQVKVYIYRARVFLKDYIGTPENVV
jgi:RNA polymerase sigma-70 factor (ECF subfamily)